MPSRLATRTGAFLTAVLLAAAALHAEIPQAANLISNPSFEEGEDNDPVDWVYFLQHEKTTGTSDASVARTGARGVSVKGEGGVSFGRWITPYRIPLEGGTKYRVSFWYRGKGGEVYLYGHPAQLNSSGKLTLKLNNPFKISVAKPAQADVWTFVETEITSPGSASWAQLALSGSARDTVAFDDISIERSGLTLLEPRVSQIVPPGTVVTLKFNAPELRSAAAGSVTWKAGPGTVFKSATKNAADNTWDVAVAPQSDAALDIEAAVGTGKAVKLNIPKFFRVTPSGSENLFAFAAITDAHFYRPGTNERNTTFARVATTLNALDPLFVISLGDQMEIHSGQRDENKKWICESVRQQLGTLAAPVFTVAGNHEIDRAYEGPGTRWYQEKYLDQPRFWDFRVGKTLFIGLDVSSPGVAAREHGASFLDPTQDARLDALLSGPREAPPIIAAHISPFSEWADLPDRDRFLSLLLGKKAGVLLTGHTHYTADIAVPNGQTAPTWPTPEPLNTPADALAAINAPDKTTILTTTTVCALPRGNNKTLGFRYLLVRDGRIAWQDVLPSSLEVTRSQTSTGTVSFTIKNSPEKALTGLPLMARLPAGSVSATVDGKSVPCATQALADGSVLALVQADVAVGATATAIITSTP